MQKKAWYSTTQFVTEMKAFPILMRISKILLCLPLAAFFFLPVAAADWVWSPEEGRFVNPETEAKGAADEQYHYAMQFYKEGNLEEAVKQFEMLIENYREAPIAAEAQYRLGTIYEENADYGKAFEAYKELISTYPHSERLNEVVEREFRIGNLYLSGKKGKIMGLEILPSLPKAVEIYKHIVDNAPYSEYGDKAQFHLGLAYRQMGRFEESMEAFQALLEQYPQSDLVPKARFQLAEVSFDKSAYQFRDQRALDDAATQVDRFLERHPDSAASEKAARLRQEIDEKNAEKNYGIGLYYEKTNYVQSALIYYSDVARRYPHTQWGQKAMGKMKALEAPAEYINAEVREVETEIEAAREQLRLTENETEREQLKRRLERLDEKRKRVEKSKEETLDSRKQDLERRENELKEKFKNLKKKKKLLEKNPSEDLRRALERWELSLEGERTALLEEKRQLADWHHRLGKDMDRNVWDFVPFIGEDEEGIDKVRAIEAKKFFNLAREKKMLLSEKELLYKQHDEILLQLDGMDQLRSDMTAQGESFEATEEKGMKAIQDRKADLEALRAEIEELKGQLEEKKEIYESHYGKSWTDWLTMPAGLVTVPTTAMVNSLAGLNPFQSDEKDLRELPLEKLLEREMHFKEKLAAQKGLVDTLSQAFNEELALQERQRLLKTMESQEDIDVRKLRADIRTTEKAIRMRYEEIKDRHEKKQGLLSELESLVEQSQEKQNAIEKAVTGVSGPARGVFRMSKAFIFGLEPHDVQVTKSATSNHLTGADREKAERLKAEIEAESLVIEARYTEIGELQKDLEILKAKASLAGGQKFRSAMVELPYAFIQEAVESANRLIPRKDREEVLIHLLDKETAELETMRAEYKIVQDLIQEKTKIRTGKIEPKEPEVEKTADESAAPEKEPDAREAELRKGMESVAQKLAERQRAYDSQLAVLRAQRRVIENELETKKFHSGQKKEGKRLTKEEESLRDELEEVEESIRNLIEKERELEQEEFDILNRRIRMIDNLVGKTLSRAAVEDLLVERKRMEERLSQIELRLSFLSKELERFEMARPSPNPSIN